MRAAPQFAIGVAVGAGLVALGMVLAPARERPPSSPAGGTSDSAPPKPGADAEVAADPIAGLAAAIARLEQRLDERQDRVTVPAPAAGTAAVGGDEAMLTRVVMAALERWQREELAWMSDDELLAAAQQAMLPGSVDGARARRALDVLLERELSPAARVKALQQLGIVQRACHDLDGSTRSLQQLVDLCGLDSKAGAGAAYQLIWNLNERRDYARALDLANAVAHSAGADAMLRMQARWGAAITMRSAGNTAEAEAALRAILSDCGADRRFESLVQDIQRRLNGR